MKIRIYPIKSPLHDEAYINEKRDALLKELTMLTGDEYVISDIDHLYDGDLQMILVESGGSEGYFLEVYEKLKSPIYLLTYGTNNSLAASLEILSYIQQNGAKGEILHGSDSYIASRIKECKRCID